MLQYVCILTAKRENSMREKKTEHLTLRLSKKELRQLGAIRKGLEELNFPGLQPTTAAAVRYCLDAGMLQLRKDSETIKSMREAG